MQPFERDIIFGKLSFVSSSFLVGIGPLRCNDLDGVRAEHCGARVYLGNYCFGAEPAAAHSTP